jgi:hypothetical protein
VEAKFDTSVAIINRYAGRPNGGVIMIHSDGVNKFIDNFAPDGTRESSVRLEPPPTAFFPRNLLYFIRVRFWLRACNITSDTKHRPRSTTQLAAL